MTKEVNFVPYWPVQLEFVLPVLRPVQKCSCFVSVQIPAVPEPFRAYRDKYRVSAVKQIPEETEKLKKPTPQISRSTSSLLPRFFLIFFVFVSATHFFFFSFVSLASVSTTPSSSSFISQRVCLSFQFWYAHLKVEKQSVKK